MSPSPQRIRVLVADDEPALRGALAELLAQEERIFFVGAAADADEAIALAQREQPDVALLDVKMPAGGGPRAAREIQRLSPGTRVIALSAFEDRPTVLEMLRAGAVGEWPGRIGGARVWLLPNPSGLNAHESVASLAAAYAAPARAAGIELSVRPDMVSE